MFHEQKIISIIFPLAPSKGISTVRACEASVLVAAGLLSFIEKERKEFDRSNPQHFLRSIDDLILSQLLGSGSWKKAWTFSILYDSFWPLHWPWKHSAANTNQIHIPPFASHSSSDSSSVSRFLCRDYPQEWIWVVSSWVPVAWACKQKNMDSDRS